jgi:hypothetical protein
MFLCIFQLLYWLLAFCLSVAWGIYGVRYEATKDISIEEIIKSPNPESKMIGELATSTMTTTYNNMKIATFTDAVNELGTLNALMAFLSDFLLSFFGWLSLYVLSNRVMCTSDLGSFDVFLGTIAIIGIPGYGFKIADKLEGLFKS